MQHQQLDEDLRFIRSMIERTRPRIDAAAPIMITWGVIILVSFPLTEWLIHTGRREAMYILWLATTLIGGSLSAYFGQRAKKRCASLGVTPYLAKQISWIWAVLIPNAFVWTWLIILGPAPGYLVPFVLAAVYGIGLAMMGILYSKEWIVASLAVFAAIPVAAFHLDHCSTLLSAVVGLSFIVPALISLRRQSAERKAVHGCEA